MTGTGSWWQKGGLEADRELTGAADLSLERSPDPGDLAVVH